MNFFFRKCLKVQPFVIGLVNFKHDLQNVNHSTFFYDYYCRLRGEEEEDNEHHDPIQDNAVYYQDSYDKPVIEEEEYINYKRTKDLRRIVYTEIKNSLVPGLAVKVSVNGNTFFKEGFGYRDCENQIKVTADMRSNVASISKIFTAYMVIKWLQDGKFNTGSRLNTQVHENYLDPTDKHTFTYESLLCHQANLRHYSNQENFNATYYDSLTKAIGVLYKFHGPTSSNLIFKKKFDDPDKRYTSIGYDILGSCFEIKKDEPFYLTCSDELCQLYMKDTFPHYVADVMFDCCRGYEASSNDELYRCETDRWLIQRNLEEGNTQEKLFEGIKFRPNRELSSNYYVDYSMKFGSEGLVSTVDDIVKFGDMFLYMEQGFTYGRPLSEETAKVMWSYFSKTKASLGMGWKAQIDRIRKDSMPNSTNERYLTSMFHAGSAVGFTSLLYVTSVKRYNYLYAQPKDASIYKDKVMYRSDLQTASTNNNFRGCVIDCAYHDDDDNEKAGFGSDGVLFNPDDEKYYRTPPSAEDCFNLEDADDECFEEEVEPSGLVIYRYPAHDSSNYYQWDNSKNSLNNPDNSSGSPSSSLNDPEDPFEWFDIPADTPSKSSSSLRHIDENPKCSFKKPKNSRSNLSVYNNTNSPFSTLNDMINSFNNLMNLYTNRNTCTCSCYEPYVDEDDDNDSCNDEKDSSNDPNSSCISRNNQLNKALQDLIDSLIEKAENLNSSNISFDDPVYTFDWSSTNNSNFSTFYSCINPQCSDKNPNNKSNDQNDSSSDPNGSCNDPDHSSNDPDHSSNDPDHSSNDPDNPFNDLDDPFDCFCTDNCNSNSTSGNVWGDDDDDWGAAAPDPSMQGITVGLMTNLGLSDCDVNLAKKIVQLLLHEVDY